MKPCKSAPGDIERWAVESYVSIATMRRVLAGGALLGRASMRAYRYLESHGLLDFIERPAPATEAK
jgi:hypothetical protein